MRAFFLLEPDAAAYECLGIIMGFSKLTMIADHDPHEP
jgi:hypothetical protein